MNSIVTKAMTNYDNDVIENGKSRLNIFVKMTSLIALTKSFSWTMYAVNFGRGCLECYLYCVRFGSRLSKYCNVKANNCPNRAGLSQQIDSKCLIWLFFSR